MGSRTGSGSQFLPDDIFHVRPDVSFNLVGMEMVIRQGRIDLGQRQGRQLVGDFFGRDPQLVMADNRSHGCAGAGDDGASAAQVRVQSYLCR